MGKIRVLVVDDSVVVRRAVSDALAGDPDVVVAGSAPSGRIALQKIPQVNPDLITLDIEMPDLDGLETLAALRKDYPRLPVIMFSTLTRRGATATLDALAAGATDYVTKPTGLAVPAALAFIRAELLPRIKALGARARPAVRATKLPPLARAEAALRPRGPIEVLAIGVSTGGPNALADLLPKLPESFPVPVVVVQHMPPMFTRLLADRLDAQCALQVVEAQPGDELEAGGVWIAPGDYHMVLRRDGAAVRIGTHRGPHENSCRPSVDVLFRSVGDVYGDRALAVVLTGMGQDGLLGCERLHEAGARILVQDEATSVVWGMPGFVANAGLAEAVLPLDALGPAITLRAREGRDATRAATLLTSS
jgi:two-component system chemotaxis response regulator CheB